MPTNLFGEKIIKEESIEITYNGPSFENKMAIKDLYIQLEAVESIVKNTADVLKRNKKIDLDSNDLKIFLKLKRGSFGEIIEIVFKSPIFQQVISGCIIATYVYFLTNKNNKSKKFQKEIEEFEKNKKFKLNIKKVVSPINVAGDQINIVGDNNKIIIKQNQKEGFYRALEAEEENELLKNGEFEEELTGVVRKLDLDAQKNNYFGFNINKGPSKIPTAIKGEFNLNIFKELINEPIKIKAMVRYKDDTITHVEILDYKILNRSKQTSLFKKLE